MSILFKTTAIILSVSAEQMHIPKIQSTVWIIPWWIYN